MWRGGLQRRAAPWSRPVKYGGDGEELLRVVLFYGASPVKYGGDGVKSLRGALFHGASGD